MSSLSIRSNPFQGPILYQQKQNQPALKFSSHAQAHAHHPSTKKSPENTWQWLKALASNLMFPVSSKKQASQTDQVGSSCTEQGCTHPHSHDPESDLLEQRLKKANNRIQRTFILIDTWLREFFKGIWHDLNRLLRLEPMGQDEKQEPIQSAKRPDHSPTQTKPLPQKG